MKAFLTSLVAAAVLASVAVAHAAPLSATSKLETSVPEIAAEAPVGNTAENELKSLVRRGDIWEDIGIGLLNCLGECLIEVGGELLSLWLREGPPQTFQFPRDNHLFNLPGAHVNHASTSSSHHASSSSEDRLAEVEPQHLAGHDSRRRNRDLVRLIMHRARGLPPESRERFFANVIAHQYASASNASARHLHDLLNQHRAQANRMDAQHRRQPTAFGSNEHHSLSETPAESPNHPPLAVEQPGEAHAVADHNEQHHADHATPVAHAPVRQNTYLLVEQPGGMPFMATRRPHQ